MKPSALFCSIGCTHTLGLQCSSAWVTSRESLQYNTLNFCFLYPSVCKITRDHDDWIHCFTPPKLFFSMDCCAFVEFLVQQNKTKKNVGPGFLCSSILWNIQTERSLQGRWESVQELGMADNKRHNTALR